MPCGAGSETGVEQDDALVYVKGGGLSEEDERRILRGDAPAACPGLAAIVPTASRAKHPGHDGGALTPAEVRAPPLLRLLRPLRRPQGP